MRPVRALCRVSILVAVTAIALSLSAASASASSLYSQVLHVYQTTGGAIPACKFTSTQLESVLKSADTYENQYFADFSNAIDAALSQRAIGICGGAASAPETAALGPASHAPPLKLGPVTAATGARIPAPIVLLAALAGLLAALFGVAWLARVCGWDPAWAATWRHAWGEAEYRISGGWTNVVDRWRRRG